MEVMVSVNMPLGLVEVCNKSRVGALHTKVAGHVTTKKLNYLIIGEKCQDCPTSRCNLELEGITDREN